MNATYRSINANATIRHPRVLPLIELEPRDKNKRVGRDERKLMAPDFKVFGHLMTL